MRTGLLDGVKLGHLLAYARWMGMEGLERRRGPKSPSKTPACPMPMVMSCDILIFWLINVAQQGGASLRGGDEGCRHGCRPGRAYIWGVTADGASKAARHLLSVMAAAENPSEGHPARAAGFSAWTAV